MKLARYNSLGDVHTYIHDDRAYSGEVMTSVRLSIVISLEYLDTCTHRSWQPEAATEQGTPHHVLLSRAKPESVEWIVFPAHTHTHATLSLRNRRQGVYDLVVWSRAESFTGVMYVCPY